MSLSPWFPCLWLVAELAAMLTHWSCDVCTGWTLFWVLFSSLSLLLAVTSCIGRADVTPRNLMLLSCVYISPKVSLFSAASFLINIAKLLGSMSDWYPANRVNIGWMWIRVGLSSLAFAECYSSDIVFLLPLKWYLTDVRFWGLLGGTWAPCHDGPVYWVFYTCTHDVRWRCEYNVCKHWYTYYVMVIYRN